MNNEQVDTTAQRRVNINDVKTALINEDGEETSPFKTNAKKIRTILGFGSQGTIQKHLVTLRDNINQEKLKASISHTDTTAPNPPKDLLSSIWQDAWRAAQIVTLSRVETLTIERETLVQTVSAQVDDIAGLTELYDNLESETLEYNNNIERLKKEQELQLEQEKLDADNEINRLNSEVEEKSQNLEQAKNEITSIKKDALHAKELADRDALLTASVMQNTIDKLSDQLSELKAMRISTKNKDKKE